MTVVADPPLLGIEAQHVFLRHRDNDAAYAVVEAMLPLSYELHLGPQVRDLIARGLTAARAATTEAEVDAAFAASREEYASRNFGALFTQDKSGNWRRTMRTTGLLEMSGHFVDIGNPNNKFGRYLLELNSACTQVTGVDDRLDPSRAEGPGLAFAHQSDERVVPLADDTADVVAFRLALHHKTTEVQDALLAEARRVLRPGGEVVLVEDSYSDDIPPLNDNALTMAFTRLSDADRMAVLALLDASSCLTTHELIPFPFTYRTIPAWESALRYNGFTEFDSTYWGFPMFTQYAAPMGVIRAR